MTLLRSWLVVTALVLAAMAIWAFAPVLLLVLALVAVLGAFSAVMVLIARRLQVWRHKE